MARPTALQRDKAGFMEIIWNLKENLDKTS
jgi:hypothetical protein